MAVAFATVALLLLFAYFAVAVHTSTEFFPSPSPFAGGGTQVPVGAFPISAWPSSSSPLAAPSPGLSPQHLNWPPAPPLPAPFPSPLPPPAAEPTRSPALAPAGDLIRAEGNKDLQSSVAEKERSSNDENGGMSGGKNAAVAVGLVAGAALMGIVVVVYKKRQDNIRRARYGLATRRDLL